MNMKKAFVIISILVGLAISSCKKEFDLPPKKSEPAVSGYITIDSIYKVYTKHYKTPPSPTTLYRFSDDVNLECVVTADEVSGNIYKGVYVEDATGALKINLTDFGGLYVGDKIRINLKGALLNDYGRVVQLDSINIEKRVVKLSSGNPVVPKKVTFNEFLLLNAIGNTPMQSRLVMIDSVEFVAGDKGQMFADPVGKNSIDRTLLSADGKQVTVRSSGYANFAGNLIPCGKGSMIVIVGQFNTTIQLIIRDFKEVKLAANGCPLLVKTFNDGSISSGGWSNVNANGSVNWKVGSYNGKIYGEISNYSFGSNSACETWLISPAINTSGAANPSFSFETAKNFSGPNLEVYVSTNYTGGAPSTATWTLLSPPLSGGSWNWVYSGKLPLSDYKSANTRIAFKYSGTNSSGSTWEVDDITVYSE
jgi:hypothetical protein